MNTHIRQLLIRSLDQQLSQEELLELNLALEKNPALRNEQQELIETRKLIENQQFGFQPFFASKVMQKLQKTAKSGKDLLESMYFAFLRISLPTLAVCIVLLLLIWYNEGSFSIETLTGVSDLSFDELLNDMFVYNGY